MPEENKPRRESSKENSNSLQQPPKRDSAAPKTPATPVAPTAPQFDPAHWDFMVA